MKKLLFLPFLILVLFSSCKKEKKQTTIKTNYENQFSLKRDGTLQVLSISNAYLSGSSVVIEAGSAEATSGYYRMSFQDDISPGNYEYGASILPVITFYFHKTGKTYEAYDGNFHIISNDTVAKRIEVRFEIKIYDINFPSDHFEITEGHVVANY